MSNNKIENLISYHELSSQNSIDLKGNSRITYAQEKCWLIFYSLLLNCILLMSLIKLIIIGDNTSHVLGSIILNYMGNSYYLIGIPCLSFFPGVIIKIDFTQHPLNKCRDFEIVFCLRFQFRCIPEHHLDFILNHIFHDHSNNLFFISTSVQKLLEVCFCEVGVTLLFWCAFIPNIFLETYLSFLNFSSHAGEVLLKIYE